MTKNNVKLTTLTTKGGCGCKIGPTDLADIIKQLPSPTPNPNVLVGLDTSDDAGVYQINEDTAIVQTLDFFTPIVDDPYSFGQIAAANAISDIYAMGGTPITALNIVAFPVHTLDKEILADILRGAGDKLTEAGVALVGGHSIDDKEPKFGLAVTGIIHPAKVRTNSGVKPNDKLILTKPIGVGVLTTSIKRNLLTDTEIEHVTKVMATLNKVAAHIMQRYEIHACTDITGFGLLGHTSEMAIGSEVSLTIYDHKVPKLPRVKELAELGAIPGGTKNNFQHVQGKVSFPSSMDQIDQWILCDAVTSGGLLMAVKDKEADKLLSELQAEGIHAAIIGEATEDTKAHIYVQE